MRITLVQPHHSKVSHNTHAHSSGKEQRRIEEHLAQTRAGAGACAQHAGEDYDADDIINDGSTDDGSAEKALQVAQFLQGRHRNGHAGGGHDGADEQCTVELRAAHGREAVERTVQQGAAHQRNGNAHAGDQGGDGAGFDEFLQIGAKARGEHQHDHADLRKGGDGVTGLHEVQDARTDEQAGNDLAHHLRCLALAGHETKELCAEDDNCQVTENQIHKESFLYYKIPRTIYTFLPKTDNRERRDGRSPAALPFIL